MSGRASHKRLSAAPTRQPGRATARRNPGPTIAHHETGVDARSPQALDPPRAQVAAIVSLADHLDRVPEQDSRRHEACVDDEDQRRPVNYRRSERGDAFNAPRRNRHASSEPDVEVQHPACHLEHDRFRTAGVHSRDVPTDRRDRRRRPVSFSPRSSTSPDQRCRSARKAAARPRYHADATLCSWSRRPRVTTARSPRSRPSGSRR